MTSLFNMSFPHSQCRQPFLCVWLTLSAKSLQLFPTLCDPVDCSLPGSSIHGIFQVRKLECFAISLTPFGIWYFLCLKCPISPALDIHTHLLTAGVHLLWQPCSPGGCVFSLLWGLIVLSTLDWVGLIYCSLYCLFWDLLSLTGHKTWITVLIFSVLSWHPREIMAFKYKHLFLLEKQRTGWSFSINTLVSLILAS